MKPARDDLRGYAATLTLLTLLRCFEGGKKEDLKPIVSPMEGSIRESVMNYSKQFARRIRRPHLDPWGFHFTTKRGPNGHALATAISDALAMTPEVIQACGSISPGIDRAIENYRALVSQNYIELGTVTDSRPVQPGSERIARIVSIPAPEGKTRVIAQQGYYVQAALKPLHDSLIRILKSIPQDLTYTQSRGPSRLKIESGNSFHSLDLTAATDRFPIELQVRLLGEMYSESLANG